MSACLVCTADNQNELEAVGVLAQTGEISWREAARRALLKHHAGLKNHMETHYVDHVEEEVQASFDVELDAAVAELTTAMHMAPPEVKPLYFAAIHNLRELRHTKPSQQHLIMALRTIQEMTGMKQEQRMMLQFAEAMFRELPEVAAKALPAAEVIDVDEV